MRIATECMPRGSRWWFAVIRSAELMTPINIMTMMMMLMMMMLLLLLLLLFVRMMTSCWVTNAIWADSTRTLAYIFSVGAAKYFSYRWPMVRVKVNPISGRMDTMHINIFKRFKGRWHTRYTHCRTVLIYWQWIISFCHNPRVWQTDGRTDRQMLTAKCAQTELDAH